MLKTFRVTAVAAAVILSLSACSGGGSTATGDKNEETLTKLSVGVSPGAETSAPAYLAIERGVFVDHGLDVELGVLEDGAVAIPNTLNGQTQFSMAGFGSAVQAIETGIPIQLIGAANVISTDPDSKYQAIIVNKESGITEMSQVETWASDSTDVDPSHALAVDALGGDYLELKRIAVPFPAIGDAVVDGNADAAFINEPFLSAALDSGSVEVLSYIAGELTVPGAPGAVFIGSVEYMDANPEITAQFMAAIQEAYSYAYENVPEIAEYIPQTGLSDEVPEATAIGEYQVGPLKAEPLQKLIDIFIEYGAIEGNVPAKDMIRAQ